MARGLCNCVGLLGAFASIPALWLWHTVGSASSTASTAVSIVELPAVRHAIASELVYRLQQPNNSADVVALDGAAAGLVDAGAAGLQSPATQQVVRAAVEGGYHLLTNASSGAVRVDIRPGLNSMLDAMRAIDHRVPGLPGDFGVVTIGTTGSRPPNLSSARSIDRAIAFGGLGAAFVGFLAAWLLSRRGVDRKLRGLGWKIAVVGALWVILAQLIRLAPASFGDNAHLWTKAALSSAKAWLASSLTLFAGVVTACGLAIVVTGAVVGAVRRSRVGALTA